MDPAATKARIKKLQQIVVAFLLAYVAIYYGLILFVSQDYLAIVSDIMGPVGIGLSLLPMFWAIQLLSTKRIKRIWTIFFMGTVTFLFGEIVYSYGELIHGTTPFTSMADIWYTISGILILMGFFLHIPFRSRLSTVRSGFDVLIMMVVYTTLEAKYILMPIMNNVALSTADKFAMLMFPTFDAGLFMAILLFYFNDADEQIHYRSKILVVIAVVWLFADQAYSVASILGIYKSGSWIDPLWPAAFIGLSIAALRSAEFYLLIPEATDNNVQNSTVGMINNGIFITYGSMIIFMTMWCIDYYVNEPLSIGGIFVILLLIVRQYLALLENRGLLRLLIKTNEDLQEAKSRIEYDLKTDYLTRLFNRRYVDIAVAEMQKTTKIKPSPFSVLVLDIDHFKNINDQYGHSTGDQVLKQVATIINANIRKEDIAARWGGEEFIVILPDTDESLAYTIGERIRSEIATNSFESDSGQQNIRLSVSIGISEVDSLEQDFWKVLLRADQGMYEAKYAGRNRTVVKRVG